MTSKQRQCCAATKYTPLSSGFLLNATVYDNGDQTSPVTIKFDAGYEFVAGPYIQGSSKLASCDRKDSGNQEWSCQDRSISFLLKPPPNLVLPTFQGISVKSLTCSFEKCDAVKNSIPLDNPTIDNGTLDQRGFVTLGGLGKQPLWLVCVISAIVFLMLTSFIILFLRRKKRFKKEAVTVESKEPISPMNNTPHFLPQAYFEQSRK